MILQGPGFGTSSIRSPAVCTPWSFGAFVHRSLSAKIGWLVKLNVDFLIVGGFNHPFEKYYLRHYCKSNWTIFPWDRGKNQECLKTPTIDFGCNKKNPNDEILISLNFLQNLTWFASQASSIFVWTWVPPFINPFISFRDPKEAIEHLIAFFL